ncbi:MAG: hypothetical protein ACUVTX_05615 [Bacteroidales bacterium]
MRHSSSRKITISCNDREFYDFVTDIRNFGRFIPDSIKKKWTATNDSCSFLVPGLGEINLLIQEKKPYKKVVFKGNAISRINFIIETGISEKSKNKYEVNLTLNSEMDQFTGLIALPNIEKIIDVLASEMEKFSDWNNK